jgi:hypothetical protein
MRLIVMDLEEVLAFPDQIATRQRICPEELVRGFHVDRISSADNIHVPIDAATRCRSVWVSHQDGIQ